MVNNAGGVHDFLRGEDRRSMPDDRIDRVEFDHHAHFGKMTCFEGVGPEPPWPRSSMSWSTAMASEGRDRNTIGTSLVVRRGSLRKASTWRLRLSYSPDPLGTHKPSLPTSCPSSPTPGGLGEIQRTPKSAQSLLRDAAECRQCSPHVDICVGRLGQKLALVPPNLIPGWTFVC